MVGSHKTLGIALNDSSALVAEVRGPRGRPTVTRAAEFTFPPDASIAEPLLLGQALKQWLRREGSSAKRAVVGLPAKWLLSREEAVPTAERAAVADMLRLKAEQHFSIEPDELCVDCCGGLPDGRADSALLVAALRERVERVAELARAAGISLQAITASSLALASAITAQSSATSCCLCLGPAGGEMTLASAGRFRLLRHFPWSGVSPTDAVETVSGELRRAAAQVSVASGPEGKWDVTIWSNGTLRPLFAPGSTAEEPYDVRTPEGLSAIGVAKTPFSTETDGTAFAAAAALGLLGMGGDRLPVDFLHSTLAVRRQTKLKRPVLWSAGLAASLAIAGFFFVSDWRAQQATLSDLRTRLAEMTPELEEIRDISENVSFARAWCDAEPRYLKRLRELTLAFPEQGTVWATSIAVRGDRGGVLSGKATDEKAVLAVMDEMNDSGGFADVKLLYMREAGGGGRELSFAISFAFPGLE